MTTSTSTPPPINVLSIQSHVVSGYVGNRAATFPLQLLGYNVDVINTVEFSNHTGYGSVRGHRTTPEQLEALFEGLRMNELGGRYGRVLTGYVPSAAALEVIREEIEKLAPDVYLLDPVMGDDETGLYVSPDVVPVYRKMLPMATIITPNHYELELLAETKIDSDSSLDAALAAIHARGVPNIVVSSMPVAGGLVCVASTPTSKRMFHIDPVQGYFSGVGDLFSAMVLARYDGDLGKAVAQALTTVQKILRDTAAKAGTSMHSKELHIIQSTRHILDTAEWV